MNKKHLKDVFAMPNAGRKKVASVLGVSDVEARILCKIRDEHETLQEFLSEELVKTNKKLEAKVQRYQDLNRILKKHSREHDRVSNALEGLVEELISELKKTTENLISIDHKTKIEETTLLVQFSDPHLNELIDMADNRYDFIVASKRMQKFANEIKLEAKLRGSKKIILAMTGDLLNSDRRIDELLSLSTNRAKASLIATKLITYLIMDLNTVADVTVTYVTGNESRIRDDWGYVDDFVSDNYDTLIFHMLRDSLGGKAGIDFIDGDPWEMVLNINGKNILISHGASIKSNTQAGIQQVIGKFAAKGVIVDYILIGHIHFANVTDVYSRSGSLAGCNTYSDRALNLITKASQLLHIITVDGDIHNKRVDLQNTVGYEGYPIQDDLDAYNAKSASKVRSSETIIRIIT